MIFWNGYYRLWRKSCSHWWHCRDRITFVLSIDWLCNAPLQRSSSKNFTVFSLNGNNWFCKGLACCWRMQTLINEAVGENHWKCCIKEMKSQQRHITQTAHSLEDIVDYHVRFERIHPFQDLAMDVGIDYALKNALSSWRCSVCHYFDDMKSSIIEGLLMG